MTSTFEPATILRILQNTFSSHDERTKFSETWSKNVKKRVAAWTAQKDSKHTSKDQLEWEAAVMEYVNFIYSKTKGKDGVPSKLNAEIPLYGPQFIPPSYMHQMLRNPACTISPETTYLLPMTVIHPVFYPNKLLQVCPRCGSNEILWDSWNATGARDVHGVTKNERAIGYQLRCQSCLGRQSGSTNDSGYCFSTVSAVFWEKWAHWKIPHEIPCFLYRSAMTRELFDLLVELRPSTTSAGLSENMKQLHLLRYHKEFLKYLSYFHEASATRNYFKKIKLEKMSAPGDRKGYGDTPISNDSITDVYLDFVNKTRQPESIQFCQTRSAISLSLDNTFKSAGKAVVVDKDKTRKRLFKGGILSVINENSETLVWRFCQSASPVEIGEALKDIKDRHDSLHIEQPKVVVVDNCCQVRRFITDQIPGVEVKLDIYHFVQRYNAAILNSSKNPHRAEALKDIRDAVMEEPASKGKPAKYYPKDIQTKKLAEAYEKWSEKGVWSAAGTRIHEDQLAHVRKGCLARTYQDIATDGSRIEGSHKGWNSLQRAQPSGLEVYTALGHDFVHRRNIRIATSKAEKGKNINLGEFLGTTYDSHHTELVNHAAGLWNTLLARERATVPPKLLPAPQLPKIELKEKFGLVPSAHTSTFGGLIKDEPITDESRLINDLDEMVEELDEGTYYQTLGVKRHLFHIPAKSKTTTKTNLVSDTSNTCLQETPARVDTPSLKRKTAPEVDATTRESRVVPGSSERVETKRVRRGSATAAPTQGRIDQLLGIVRENNNKYLTGTDIPTNDASQRLTATDNKNDTTPSHSDQIIEATSSKAPVAATPTSVSSKCGLTRSQALFSLSTQVDPRSLAIGRGFEFYLFMDMRAEFGWLSCSMPSGKWVTMTKEYNARLVAEGKKKNSVVVAKNPRALMEKLIAVELDICGRVINDNFFAKSSGTDTFWKKHCFAVSALLKPGDEKKPGARKPPSCGRCHTLMYPGVSGSPENHKKGYCADGVRQKPKPESKDASLPKWPQPTGIFAAGTTFNVIKFLEHIQIIYEKTTAQSNHVRSIQDLELSLDEMTFVEMLQSRIIVSNDGAYFRLYDLETIGGGALIIEKEGSKLLRIDYLSSNEA